MSLATNSDLILLVDEDELTLEMEKMALELVFDGPIKAVMTIEQAVDFLKHSPQTRMIVTDHYVQGGCATTIEQFLLEKKLDTSLVVCSNLQVDEIKKNYNRAPRFIEKNNLIKPLMELTKNILSKNDLKSSKEFCGIRVPTLLRLGFVNYDLFVKLSENKFVKLSKAGEPLAAEGARKLLSKKINRLYLKAEDAHSLLLEFQKNAAELEKISDLSPIESVFITYEASDLVHNLFHAFGWSKEIEKTIEKSVHLALREISMKPKLIEMLMAYSQMGSGYVASHSSTLIYICCGLAQHLDWTSDYTFKKISMAALLHDITLLPDLSVEDILKLNEEALAMDNKKRSKDLEQYMKHPILSAELLNHFDDLLPDIDKIILQHHERPDGSGFPAKLAGIRIHPLAALFIVSEDLILFLENSKDLKKGLQDFVQQRETTYQSKYFKSVLGAIGRLNNS